MFLLTVIIVILLVCVLYVLMSGFNEVIRGLQAIEKRFEESESRANRD